MIRYRIDVLAYLKHMGYSQFRLKKEGLIAGRSLDNIRNGNTDISMKTLETLCKLTELSIEDILEYIPD